MPAIRLAMDKHFFIVCGRESVEIYKDVGYKMNVPINCKGAVDLCQFNYECVGDMVYETHYKSVALVLPSFEKRHPTQNKCRKLYRIYTYF